MKLSIIIVNYNTCDLTIDCIKSIDKFAPKFSFEVIVVDNASSDDSISKLKKLKTKKFKIKLIENKKNLGFSKANNIGIKSSKGQYVLLLNSDTLLMSNVFEELLAFAQKHEDAGVVAPKLLNKDKSIQPSIYNFPSIKNAITQYWLNREKLLDKFFVSEGDFSIVDAVVGAAFLITPKALEKVGVLDEKYFMYFEDIDYCKKVKDAGLSVYYLPGSQLIHLHGASGNKEVNRLLIESSKKYFGIPLYYLYTFVLWSGQKLQKLIS